MPTTTLGHTRSEDDEDACLPTGTSIFGSVINSTVIFVGAHLHGGVYQAAAIDMPWGIWPELKDHRFKGHFYGFGVSYGYQWILGKHWNLEGNIGIGYARVKYEQFECKTCGEKVKEGHKNYVGPTKAAVSLIYLF